MKEDEMNGACNTDERDMKCMMYFAWKT